MIATRSAAVGATFGGNSLLIIERGWRVVRVSAERTQAGQTSAKKTSPKQTGNTSDLSAHHTSTPTIIAENATMTPLALAEPNIPSYSSRTLCGSSGFG